MYQSFHFPKKTNNATEAKTGFESGSINLKNIVYSFAPSTIADSEMSFKTTAQEIFISYLSGTGTNDMVVLVDGKEVKTFSTNSEYPNMNYVTAGVTGVSGKTVTIKAKNNSPLRIFAIIERFNK